jgi:two-component system LytT family response regulator
MSAVVPLLWKQPDGVPSSDIEARLAALEAMLGELRPRRLPVRDGARIVLLDRDSIEWIEAAGNYVVIHSSGKTFVARDTLEGLQAELGSRFLRVRRDALVNSAAVRELHPLFRGEFRLALRDGSHIQSTRRFRGALDPLIGTGPR